MGNVVPLHDPSNYVWAIRRIKSLWNEGNFEILPHAQERMKKWKLDILDIEHIVKYGRVVEHTMPQNLWRYKVQGTAVDRRRAHCMIEIDGSLIIVTVVSSRARK